MPRYPSAKLAALKRQIAALESRLSRQHRRLLALPARHGFKSMADFIAALRLAAGSVQLPKSSPARKARRRAKITPKIKAKVKAMVTQKKTGREIARALKISLPSVQNIKAALGLTQKRAK